MPQAPSAPNPYPRSMTKRTPLSALLIPLLAAAASAQTETPRGDAEIFAPFKSIASMPGQMLQEAPRGDAEIVSSGKQEAKADSLSLIVQIQEHINRASDRISKGRALERTKEMMARVAQAADAVAAQATAISELTSRLKNSGRISSGSLEASRIKAKVKRAEDAARDSEWDGHDRAHTEYDYQLMMNRRGGNYEASAADADLDVARANLERAVIETRAMGRKATYYLFGRGAIDPSEVMTDDYASTLASRQNDWARVSETAKSQGAQIKQLYGAAPTN